jgi:hypothetical protein
MPSIKVSEEMKMKISKIIAAVSAAAVAAMSVAVTSFADETPEGYVAFTAIKSTIGQGFNTVPVMVPFYEGESGLDVVNRAVETVYTESDYGAYITAFADEDTESIVPDEITAVCPEMTGRTADGYLSAYDYTAESGWSYFINGEYASVSISDYVPEDGDVLEFRFTVYGYGADLGVDNSSWGGAAAITEQLDASDLILACASADDTIKDSRQYTYAMELLAQYGVTQEEIDTAVEMMAEAQIMPIIEPDETVDTAENTADEADDSASSDNSAETSSDKGSPDTGVGSIAVVFGAVILAGGVIALSRKA